MSKTNGKPKKPDARKISKKLNLRQRRFVAEFTNPQSEAFGNQTKAAKLAGYSQERARITGSELVTNRNIQREIERIMDEAGVTGKMLAQVLRGGLKAKVTRVFCPQGGTVVYSKSLVDHPTRLRAAEIGFKLRGDFPATKTTVDLQGLENLGIDIIAQARKRARERLEST
jgi:hypothetical protein